LRHAQLNRLETGDRHPVWQQGQECRRMTHQGSPMQRIWKPICSLAGRSGVWAAAEGLALHLPVPTAKILHIPLESSLRGFTPPKKISWAGTLAVLSPSNNLNLSYVPLFSPYFKAAVFALALVSTSTPFVSHAGAWFHVGAANVLIASARGQCNGQRKSLLPTLEPVYMTKLFHPTAEMQMLVRLHFVVRMLHSPVH
jgi:hypothetical protein